jgi:hypothetical protein
MDGAPDYADALMLAYSDFPAEQTTEENLAPVFKLHN